MVVDPVSGKPVRKQNPPVANSVEEIKRSINLDDHHAITAYCSLGDSRESMGELNDLLGNSPVTLLAGKVAEIVDRLSDADPKQVQEKPGWLSRFTGASIEKNIRYEVARKNIDTLIDEADRMNKRVLDFIQSVDAILADHANEMERIKKGLRQTVCLGRNRDDSR